jgi:hypothetical protein
MRLGKRALEADEPVHPPVASRHADLLHPLNPSMAVHPAERLEAVLALPLASALTPQLTPPQCRTLRMPPSLSSHSVHLTLGATRASASTACRHALRDEVGADASERRTGTALKRWRTATVVPRARPRSCRPLPRYIVCPF